MQSGHAILKLLFFSCWWSERTPESPALALASSSPTVSRTSRCSGSLTPVTCIPSSGPCCGSRDPGGVRYRGWETLYAEFHGEYVADAIFTPPPEEGGGTPRVGVGEGPNHKALRLWVLCNPEQIDSRFGDAEALTEKELLSGDRVDVVYVAASEILAIEVKSRDSNRNDLVRGLYQCVKYRAVMRAQERRGRTVQSMLVTESELPPDLVSLAKRLEVRHRSFPPENR